MFVYEFSPSISKRERTWLKPSLALINEFPSKYDWMKQKKKKSYVPFLAILHDLLQTIDPVTNSYI